MQFNSVAMEQQHLNGKKHLKKLQESQNQGELKMRCEVCQCDMSSGENLQQHIRGRRHQKNLKMMSFKKQFGTSQPGGQGIPDCVPAVDHRNLGKYVEVRGPNGLFCTLCNISCTSDENMYAHVNGNAHLKRLNLRGEAPRQQFDNTSVLPQFLPNEPSLTSANAKYRSQSTDLPDPWQQMQRQHAQLQHAQRRNPPQYLYALAESKTRAHGPGAGSGSSGPQSSAAISSQVGIVRQRKQNVGSRTQHSEGFGSEDVCESSSKSKNILQDVVSRTDHLRLQDLWQKQNELIVSLHRRMADSERDLRRTTSELQKVRAENYQQRKEIQNLKLQLQCTHPGLHSFGEVVQNDNKSAEGGKNVNELVKHDCTASLSQTRQKTYSRNELPNSGPQHSVQNPPKALNEAL